MSKTFTVITKDYGPFRCVFRDHTKENEHAFLNGHAVKVRLRYTAETKDVTSEELEDFVSSKTNWAGEYLNELLSDTFLVSTKDPLANVIIILEQENMIDVRLMEDVTLTGLQKMIAEDFALTLKEQTDGKIEFYEVVVSEAAFA